MSATCHSSTHAEYCDGLPDVVRRLADVADKQDPASRVPTCTDWNVGDLTEHVGLIHRWACGMVEVLAPERISRATLGLKSPEDPAARPQWLIEGGRDMADLFRRADPKAPMWAWGADKHARFWARRMTHETTVHRTDAEFAAGLDPEIDTDLALDGIDEFLDNLPHAAYFAPRVKELTGAGESIRLQPSDAGTVWTIGLGSDGFSWDHSAGHAADATLEANAANLYLFVWGRRKFGDSSRFRVDGDIELVDFWVERSSI